MSEFIFGDDDSPDVEMIQFSNFVSLQEPDNQEEAFVISDTTVDLGDYQ